MKTVAQLHIPRCAGRTVRIMIESQPTLYYHRIDGPIVYRPHDNQGIKWEPHKLRVLGGHITGPSFVETFGADTFIITLRDPSIRLYSLYSHVTADHFHPDHSATRGMTFCQFLEWMIEIGHWCVYNSMCFQICGHANHELALDFIHKHECYVFPVKRNDNAVTESLSYMLYDCFEGEFNLNQKASNLHEHKSKYSTDFQAISEAKKQVANYNECVRSDFLLWQWAVKQTSKPLTSWYKSK